MTKPATMRIIDALADRATVELVRSELIALANALNEVLHGPDAIEEWEFQTRMGVERREVKALEGALQTVLGS